MTPPAAPFDCARCRRQLADTDVILCGRGADQDGGQAEHPGTVWLGAAPTATAYTRAREATGQED